MLFTSENLLAKAGGEIAANKIEEQLEGYYKKAGFSGSNTYFKFNTDGSFESKIDGKSWRGTYTFDEKTHAITMKGTPVQRFRLCHPDNQWCQPSL